MSYTRPGRARPRPQHPSRRRRRRAGFTLVEILTAIAIIAILASMGFLAYKYAAAPGRDNLTKATLQNLRGMLAEFEATGGRMKDVLAAYSDASTPPVPQPLSLTLTTPPEVIDPDNLHQYTISPPATGLTNNYYEVYWTAYKVMPRLRAVTANKSVLDALPTDHVYPRAWSSSRGYQVNERVQSGNGFYICKTAYPAGAGTQPPEADTGHWTLDAPNFLVLDAWGSPIIFVPPLGVANLTEGGEKAGDPGAVTHVVGGTGATAPKQSTDRKGYFMSAGPDRKFYTGDDNVYSFENK